MSTTTLCECSCLAARRSAASSGSYSLARLSRAGSCQQQQRTASTSSQNRLRPARGWVLPDFQAAKRAVNLPPPRIQKFESKVLLPSGGHLTIYGTTPRPSIPITRDTATHPLWSFPSTKAARGAGQDDEDEGGRLGRFAKKYAQAGSISREQAETAKDMGAASGGAGNTDTGTQAAVAAQEQAKKKSDTEKVTAKRVDLVPERDDLFDLTLEGEVYVESKHKVVEESSKKGKGKAAKKGGKK